MWTRLIKANDYYDYLSNGSGTIEIGIYEDDLKYIEDIAQSGDNSNAVSEFMALPHISQQLKQYDDKTLFNVVKELGVLDADKEDRYQLEQILIWNLAWDYSEQN
ncbi:MAG: hypothetical protein NC222_07060 [Staphylococcus sp.]|nr:hypothetical protein [Staphylococcus sp.]